MTTLASAVLLTLAARDHHASAVDHKLFRYPAFLKWLFFAFLPGSALIGISWFRHAFPNGPRDSFDWSLVGACALLYCSFAGSFFYVWSYSLCIKDEELIIHEITGDRRIAFEQIARLEVIQGAKSEDLFAYNKKGKKLFSVGDTIQDFRGLVTTLEGRTRRFGAVVRRRNSAGNWS